MRSGCVIIGSGFGGLLCALVLAKNGKKVTVIEQCKHPAPLLSSFTRNGWSCDPGFHYSAGLEPDGLLSTLFRYLEAGREIDIEPLNPNGHDVIKLPDRSRVPLPNGFAPLRKSLEENFPADRNAIAAYLNKTERILRTTSFMNPKLGFGEFSEDLNSMESLEEYLISVGASERFRKFAGAYGYTLYGTTSEETSIGAHCLAVGPFYKHTATIKGGGSGLAQPLLNKLSKLGGELITGCAVCSVSVDENRNLKGVELDNGEFMEAANVVSTVHPQLLENLLPEKSERPIFFHKLRNFTNTFSPLVVYALLKNCPPELQGATFYRFQERTTDFWGVSCAVPSDYKSTEQRVAAILRPCPEALFKACFPNDKAFVPEVYEAEKSAAAADALAEFHKCFPGCRGTLLETLTPHSYQRYTGTMRGSMFGVERKIFSSVLTPRTAIRGFYLAGQSVKSPGILGTAVASLNAVAEIIPHGHWWPKVADS